MTDTLSTLKAKAAAQMAQWPQYEGHFDNYVLVRIKRNIKSRFGQCFIKDEITMANPDLEVCEYGRLITVWSNLNNNDTQLHSRDVEVLGSVQ